MTVDIFLKENPRTLHLKHWGWFRWISTYCQVLCLVFGQCSRPSNHQAAHHHRSFLLKWCNYLGPIWRCISYWMMVFNWPNGDFPLPLWNRPKVPEVYWVETIASPYWAPTLEFKIHLAMPENCALGDLGLNSWNWENLLDLVGWRITLPWN